VGEIGNLNSFSNNRNMIFLDDIKLLAGVFLNSIKSSFLVYSFGGDFQSFERRLQNHHRIKTRRILGGSAWRSRPRKGSRVEKILRGGSPRCLE
jgi:hypothetical protein